MVSQATWNNDKSLFQNIFLLLEVINEKERENLEANPFPVAWPIFTTESCLRPCSMASRTIEVLYFHLLSQQVRKHPQS